MNELIDINRMRQKGRNKENEKKKKRNNKICTETNMNKMKQGFKNNTMI